MSFYQYCLQNDPNLAESIKASIHSFIHLPQQRMKNLIRAQHHFEYLEINTEGGINEIKKSRYILWNLINLNITLLFKKLLRTKYKEIISERDSIMCFNDGKYVGTLDFKSIKLELELAVGQNLNFFEKEIKEMISETVHKSRKFGHYPLHPDFKDDYYKKENLPFSNYQKKEY